MKNSERAALRAPASQKKYRTTVVFHGAVGENLKLFAFMSGKSVNDIIEEAVVRLLEANSMKPHLMPKTKIELSYE